MSDAPSDAAGRSDEPAPPAAASDPAGERFGPLSLLRTVKGDGRALILYSRRPPDGGSA
jgi:hypothetical protein